MQSEKSHAPLSVITKEPRPFTEGMEAIVETRAAIARHKASYKEIAELAARAGVKDEHFDRVALMAIQTVDHAFARVLIIAGLKSLPRTSPIKSAPTGEKVG